MCSFEDIREGKLLIVMINGFFAVEGVLSSETLITYCYRARYKNTML